MAQPNLVSGLSEATSASSSTTPTSLLPILLVNFIGALGFSIVLPFLVILVTDLGGNEVIYGLVGATYSAFQFIGSPLLGNWSDRIGRRKVLLVSQAGTFLAWCLFLVALLIPVTTIAQENTSLLGNYTLTLPLLLIFIARALDGITGGNISVANAYLADITPAAQKKANFGKMGAAASTGSVIGPVLGGVAGGTQYGEVVPVALALVISLVAIGFIRYYLPDSRTASPVRIGTDEHAAKSTCQTQPSAPQSPGFFRALSLPGAGYMVAMYFLFFLGFSLFFVSFPVHAIQALDWSAADIGIFFSVLSAVVVLVEGPVMSRISDTISEGPLAVAGCLVLALGFYLFTQPSEIAVYAGAVSYGVGTSILWPSFLSVLSKVGGDQYQGAIQGYAGSAGSLASIIGLVAGGLVYQQIGEGVFLVSAAWFVMLALASIHLRRINQG